MGTGPYRSRQRSACGIDLEAVEVGEVAVAGNAGRAMLVIKLVVAGRGPREKFKGAIRQIERSLKVRILAYLVLQISEERDGVRLHSLNLIRSGLLGLPQRGGWCRGLLGLSQVSFRLLTTRLRLAWLAGDVANHRQHGRAARCCVRPRIVVRRRKIGICALAPAANASTEAAAPMSTAARNLPRIVFMQFLPFGLVVG